MARYAFLVGVELFSDNRIGSVAFASADAEELGDVFRSLGVDEVEILVDLQATRTTVRSKLRKMVDRLKPDDTFYFFVASHGMSERGKNYLYCYDTQANDLKNTSLKLQWVIELMKNSGCKQCIMFLDACETGVEIDDGMRAHIGELSEDELREFFEEAEYCAAFAACRSHQKSFSTKRLQHGVWSYCLINALSGLAKEAIERKGLVTSTSLQRYLSIEVPRELRRDRPQDVQTPWQFGGLSRDFLVADVGPLVAARRKPPPLDLTQLKRVFLRNDETGEIRKLSGFSKERGHYVPKDVSSWAAGFVSGIADDEMTKDIETVFAAMRDAFKYKRKDIDCSGPSDGAASIDTPTFTYTVSVTQDSEDAARYQLRREITDIKDPDVVMSDSFNEVFDGVFDTLEFEFAKDIDLDEVIDELEAAGANVVFDSGATFCRVTLPGFPAAVVVDKRSVRIVHKRPQAPRELVGSFKTLRELAAKQDLKMLPVA